MAAAESGPAHAADDLRAILRHAHVSPARAAEFWRRVFALVDEFSSLPADDESAYGLVVGLYPTDHPTLPAPVDDRPTRRCPREESS